MKIAVEMKLLSEDSSMANAEAAAAGRTPHLLNHEKQR
jgi:hypothetical protein